MQYIVLTMVMQQLLYHHDCVSQQQLYKLCPCPLQLLSATERELQTANNTVLNISGLRSDAGPSKFFFNLIVSCVKLCASQVTAFKVFTVPANEKPLRSHTRQRIYIAQLISMIIFSQQLQTYNIISVPFPFSEATASHLLSLH